MEWAAVPARTRNLVCRSQWPLTIEVYSNEPVTMNDVAMYLSKASRLFLNTTDHGNGPGSSLILPQIEWHRIKQEHST